MGVVMHSSCQLEFVSNFFHFSYTRCVPEFHLITFRFPGAGLEACRLWACNSCIGDFS